MLVAASGALQIFSQDEVKTNIGASDGQLDWIAVPGCMVDL